MPQTIKPAIKVDLPHAPRCDHNKTSVNRINRIMGQLNALKEMVEADAGTCEERVIRARTIEKAVASLTRHMVECYLANTARLEMEADPDSAVQDITRLFELLSK